MRALLDRWGMAASACVVLAALTAEASTSGFWIPLEPPNLHYRIDARLTIDGDEVSLEAEETITLTNTAQRPITTLALEWPTGWAEMMDITVRGEPAERLPADDSESWAPAVFNLPEPLAPGETTEIVVAFPSSWDREEGDSLKLVGWYPRLTCGFAVHARYDVRFDAPEGYTVAASGRLDPATGRYTASGVKSFGVYLGKGHGVLERMSGDVAVRALHTEAGKACAEVLIETAVDAIAFYRELYGFYPYSSLTIVPGADRPMGGYPIATNLVAVHGQERMEEKSQLHWRWIAAHEVAHMYWGDYVMEKDDPGWLWIGMGIYADREYTLARDLGNEKQRELMTTYIKGAQQGADTTLGITPERLKDISYDWNNVAVHGKGFSVISALACVVGHDAFHAIALRCLEEYGGRRMGVHQFQAVCESETGDDLGWFFDQWVRSNKALNYTLDERKETIEDGRYVTEVKVERKGDLYMPVPVEATFADDTSQTQFTRLTQRVERLRFESAAALVDVRIDPKGELAMAATAPRATGGGARPRGTILEQVSAAIEALPWTNPGREPFNLFFVAIDAELEDVELWGKLAMTLYDAKFYPEAVEAFEKTAELAPEDSDWSWAGLVWQGHVHDLAEERERAQECYRQALELQSGDSVTYDHYGLTIDAAWIELRQETPFTRD